MFSKYIAVRKRYPYIEKAFRKYNLVQNVFTILSAFQHLNIIMVKTDYAKTKLIHYQTYFCSTPGTENLFCFRPIPAFGSPPIMSHCHHCQTRHPITFFSLLQRSSTYFRFLFLISLRPRGTENSHNLTDEERMVLQERKYLLNY